MHLTTLAKWQKRRWKMSEEGHHFGALFFFLLLFLFAVLLLQSFHVPLTHPYWILSIFVSFAKRFLLVIRRSSLHFHIHLCCSRWICILGGRLRSFFQLHQLLLGVAIPLHVT